MEHSREMLQAEAENYLAEKKYYDNGSEDKSNDDTPKKYYLPKTQRMPRFIRNNWGFVFVIPWLIGLIVFKMYPFFSSLYYSFTDYNLFKGITETGVMNYVDIFTDRAMTRSLRTTFAYAFMTVPLKLVCALFIAYILNFRIKFVNAFRTAYYIPSILGGSVAIAVLWKAIFRDEGVINTFLGFFAIEGPKWLSDPDYALFIICLLRVWQFGSAMVIFLAALKGVPEDLYEAATIDGASKARQLFSITIPLITPVIFYNLVTQLVQAFQEFNGPYIITQGGPRNSTTLISLLIYNNAFKTFDMGLASALAWVMFLILMVFTIISFISQKYWVYYSDESK
jgi:oligogalacturonide transport system permease protein